MEDEKEYWLDKPGSANIIFWGLCIVCALFIVPDLFLHKHGHFSWEDWTGFYGVYGLCVVRWTGAGGQAAEKDFAAPGNVL